MLLCVDVLINLLKLCDIVIFFVDVRVCFINFVIVSGILCFECRGRLEVFFELLFVIFFLEVNGM